MCPCCRTEEGGNCPAGSWAERPLGLRQPRHKFPAYGGREGRKGGKVRATEYSALEMGSAALLCRAGCRVIRRSPGLGVRWLWRPWINQTCNLGQTPSQLYMET